MPGDSLWLGSTHPKPSPTRFRGWLAPPGPELPLNMSRVHVENRGSHPCVLGSQNGRLPGDAQSRRADPKPKKIGVRHGVLRPWAPGMRHAGNVASFNTGGSDIPAMSLPSTQAGPKLSPMLKPDKIKHQRVRCESRNPIHTF